MIPFKKINAILALFTMTAFVVHTGYQTVACVIWYYNPVVQNVLGAVIMTPLFCHILLSVVAVFVLHDSKAIKYSRLNAAVLVQRISAVIMLCLFPIHRQAIGLTTRHPEGHVFWLIKVGEVVFYVALFAHISVSFSRALITLGKLKSMEKKKQLDRIVWCMCGLLFVVVSWFVIIR